jgi:hypothetical protein
MRWILLSFNGTFFKAHLDKDWAFIISLSVACASSINRTLPALLVYRVYLIALECLSVCSHGQASQLANGTIFKLYHGKKKLHLMRWKWYPLCTRLTPQICSTCRRHFPVLSSFMTYHWVNTMGVTSGAGTAYHFRGTWVYPRFLVGFVLLNL